MAKYSLYGILRPPAKYSLGLNAGTSFGGRGGREGNICPP